MSKRKLMSVAAALCASAVWTMVACAQPAAPVSQPAPAGQPAAQTPPGAAPATPPAEKKPETCLGPDGKQHEFPLKVYDENADANKTLSDGLAKARVEGKRVLAMWGENMCQFCLFLEDILANDPSCSPIVKTDYVWVRIDLGRGYSKGDIKNLGLAEYYGLIHLNQYRPDGKTMGAPALCIIDPETGRTVGVADQVRGGELTGVMGGNDMVAKPMLINHLFDEKVIYKFLMDFRPPAKAAQSVMSDAQVAAKRDGKKILALFVMPLDESCEKFGNWMTRPEVTAALGSAFVPVRVDTERTMGGREMLAKAAGKAVLPPFMTVLNDQGEPVSPAVQVTGLPQTDAEIADFIKALSGASAKLTDADKATIGKSLKDAGGAGAKK